MSADRSAIILAAVNAAGPNDGGDYIDRVIANARQISVLLSEQSPVAKVLDQMEKSKKFTAVIGSVKRETTSTRGFVKMKTKPSNHAPEGKETARTERMDNPEGLAMAKRIRELIGHRVLLWVEVEEYSGPNGSGKVRVIRHVEDLGEATGDDVADEDFWDTGWDKKAK